MSILYDAKEKMKMGEQILTAGFKTRYVSHPIQLGTSGARGRKPTPDSALKPTTAGKELSGKTFDSSVQNILIALLALAAIGFVCDSAVTIVRELGPHSGIKIQYQSSQVDILREANDNLLEYTETLTAVTIALDECAASLKECRADLGECTTGLEAATPPP